jgi:hypothetical protein
VGRVDKRKGIAFQNFVAIVERAFAVRDNVTVEVGKFITDIDSGSRREFDIWIVSKFGAYHELVTAIEVKDEKTPIGVPDVEAFITKCDRNNINRKVMVSSKGANPAAVQLAARWGVTLMTMAEAEAFEWLAIDAFTERRRTFGNNEFHVEMAEGATVPDGKWDLLDEAGDVVTHDRLNEFLHRTVPWPEDDNYPDAPVTVPVLVQGDFTLRASDGSLHAVERVSVRTTYTVTINAVPLSLHTYSGSEAGEPVYLSFAAGDLKLGEINGKLMFTRMPDQSTNISWQPNPADLKPQAKPRKVPRPPTPKREKPQA